MCRLLLVSGSLRAASTNSAVLRTAADVAAHAVDIVAFGALAGLPHFNPDDDATPLHPEVEELRAAIHAADAVLFCTPEYAGALPGSFKNLLDWTIGDDQPGSIYDKPVAWINASSRGAHGAHDELRTVLGYAHAAVVEDACVEIPIRPDAIGSDGLLSDATARDSIARAIAILLSHTACRSAEDAAALDAT
jgi:chromate reductase, NAD(P)H dehydrogenase (quinone)